MKKLFWLYTIPHIYLINWLQFFSYGMVAAIASFALFLLPFALIFPLSEKGNLRIWFEGSVLQFVSNLAFTLITNQFSILDHNGGSWRGATGIFYAEHFVLVLTCISLLFQLFFLVPFLRASNSK